jgi:hypothetical protein
MLFLFVVWWVSQDFGGIFTFPKGMATDPNSAPLLVLFLIPLFIGTFENEDAENLNFNDSNNEPNS